MTGAVTVLTRLTVLALFLVCTANGAFAEHDEHHIVDFHGEHYHIETVPERIVAIGPGALRLVASMGLMDRVVGIEGFEVPGAAKPGFRPYRTVYADVLKKLPVVSPGGPGGVMPDVERLVRTVEADMYIVVGLSPMQARLISVASRKPVVALSYGDALGMFRQQATASLRILGEVFHLHDRAAMLADVIRGVEDDLHERTADVHSHLAYIGGLRYRGGASLFSSQSGFPPLSMLGVASVGNFVPRAAKVTIDMDTLEARDPAFIFIDMDGLSAVNEELREYGPRFSALTAVRAGRVFVTPSYNSYNTNIENALIAGYVMGKVIYPDRFADVSIPDIARRVYDAFYDCGECASLLDEMVHGRLFYRNGRLEPAS